MDDKDEKQKALKAMQERLDALAKISPRDRFDRLVATGIIDPEGRVRHPDDESLLHPPSGSSKT